jgi:hypothetical protein
MNTAQSSTHVDILRKLKDTAAMYEASPRSFSEQKLWHAYEAMSAICLEGMRALRDNGYRSDKPIPHPGDESCPKNL